MKGKGYDVIIVGSGVAGLYTALCLNRNCRVLLITKKELRDCNSYLAQGGMAVLKDPKDFESYREDSLRAGHYENKIESLDRMIMDSPYILESLLDMGVKFEREAGELSYTKEGGHSKRRIVHYRDETGKEIVDKLISQLLKRENIDIEENTEMVDLIISSKKCSGVLVEKSNHIRSIKSNYTVLATGGIGGIFENSTNFPHIKGDGIALVAKYGGRIKNLSYIQYHPTVLYEDRVGRKHLLTEALRGEGAYILNSKNQRFVDELLPRDLVTKRILKEMEIESAPNVYLSLAHLDSERVKQRFPYINEVCRNKGLDLTKDKIPIVPGQHYHMGGIEVDKNSMTSLEGLFAVGECSCNGVHGRNRLASNSLLESMVFARIVSSYINSQLKLRKHSLCLMGGDSLLRQ